jgi:hypothetical protein
MRVTIDAGIACDHRRSHLRVTIDAAASTLRRRVANVKMGVKGKNGD